MIEKLRKLIKEHRHSANSLEEDVKLPRGRVGKWFQGIGEPSARQAFDIARFYSVPIEYLVDDSIESPDEIAPIFKPWELEMLKSIRALGEHEARIRLLKGPSALVASDPRLQGETYQGPYLGPPKPKP